MSTWGIRTKFFSITDRITRYTNEINTGLSDGAVVVPADASGLIWFTKLDNSQSNYASSPEVVVNQSTRTISWTFQFVPDGYRVATVIRYGTY